MADLPHPVGEQTLQNRPVIGKLVPKEQCHLLLPADCHGGEIRQGEYTHVVGTLPLGQQLQRAFRLVNLFHGAGAHDAVLPRSGVISLGRVEAHLLNQPSKLQLQKQLVQGGLVHRLAQGFLKVQLQRRVPADGGQVVGHLGRLAPLLQLLPHRGLELQGVQLLINPFYGTVALNQFHPRLLANALHPGDVV